MADISQPNKTALISHDEAATLVGAPARLRPPLTFDSAPIAWRVIFFIDTDANQSLGVELQKQLTIGRGDPDEGYVPGIDLGPFGAHDAGVSRHHAVLFSAEGSLYLRDVGSTNGTRINGYDLEANQTYRLREGDRIEFGHLTVKFHIVSSPAK